MKPCWEEDNNSEKSVEPTKRDVAALGHAQRLSEQKEQQPETPLANPFVINRPGNEPLPVWRLAYWRRAEAGHRIIWCESYLATNVDLEIMVPSTGWDKAMGFSLPQEADHLEAVQRMLLRVYLSGKRARSRELCALLQLQTITPQEIALAKTPPGSARPVAMELK